MEPRFRDTSRNLLGEAFGRLIKGHERTASIVAVLLLLIAALNQNLGKRISDSWTGLSGWWAFAPLAILFLWAILRAHHEGVVTSEAQLAAKSDEIVDLKGQISELKEIGPVVSFVDPRTEEMAVRGGGSQPFAFGCATNNQVRPGHGETAENAIVMLTYETLAGGELIGPIKGRWRDAPASSSLDPSQLHTSSEALDLAPNGSVHEFDIATKLWQDTDWYAINAKQESLALPAAGDVRVRATIKGKNFPDVEETFILHNEGYEGGLNIRRETAGH
jgi:hypothetical protein